MVHARSIRAGCAVRSFGCGMAPKHREIGRIDDVRFVLGWVSLASFIRKQLLCLGLCRIFGVGPCRVWLLGGVRLQLC